MCIMLHLARFIVCKKQTMRWAILHAESDYDFIALSIHYTLFFNKPAELTVRHNDI